MEARPLVVALLALALLLHVPAAAAAPVVVDPALSPARQAVILRDQALAALAVGDLDTATANAEAAVALDPSNLTLRAREVLFDVALRRGELSRAASELSLYASQPNRPASAGAWLRRSQERLQAESASGWADVVGVRAALARIEELGSLEPLEQAWVEQLEWRLEVRVPEQARDLEAMGTALARARQRPGLSPADDLWLEGAARRLDVLQAEWACKVGDARSALARMRGVKGLREPDQRWADLAALRIDLRAMDATGRDEAARAQLDRILSLSGLPEPERAWVAGYRVRLDLKAALARGDRDAVQRLRAAYEEWAAWEPPCTRLELSAGKENGSQGEPEAPTPWMRASALGGLQGWSVLITEGQVRDGALVQGPVHAAAAGLDLAVAWPLWRGLGLRGDVQGAPALAPRASASGDPVSGRTALYGALGVVWMNPQWELFAGAAWTHLRFSGAYVGSPVSGWNVEVLPRVGVAGELPLGPGAARAEVGGGWLPSAWSADLRLDYGLGEGALRPVAGVQGRLAGGSNTGSHDERGEVAFEFDQVDWAGAVVLGVQWRPTW